MKLSFKFFCIAYLITLLSTGIGSALLIHSSINQLWNSQVERVNAATSYATNSFLSLRQNITDTNLIDITYQIKGILDSSISTLEIIPIDLVKNQIDANLEVNHGYTSYETVFNSLVLKSVSKVETGNNEYLLTLTSDFSSLQNYQQQLYQMYYLLVISISLVSGILLYIATQQMTKPLNTLSKASLAIAKGNYGKLVKIKSKDQEIVTLTKSFNQMSKAIKQSHDQLQEEADRRHQFVANFTHEMKTPMTSIIGYAQLLQSYELTKEESQQSVSAIFHEAKRLEHLSQQLLTLFVTQNEAIEMENFPLSELKKQLHQTFQFHDQTIIIDIPDTIILVSPPLIISLFNNLIDNAFKASSNIVEIKGYEKENDVYFEIIDHGRGIEQQHLSHLTEPFYRPDKARSRKLGGAGLGLSLCESIATLHETTLTFNSQINVGTTVSFKLKKAGDHHA